MNRKLFYHIAQQQLQALPGEFQSAMDNVALIVADRPSAEQLDETGADDLLGLYEGIPLAERGMGPSFTFALPDRVYLFRRSLEEYCREEGLDLQVEIRRTLLHEIGHHLGLSERELEELEGRYVNSP